MMMTIVMIVCGMIWLAYQGLSKLKSKSTDTQQPQWVELAGFIFLVLAFIDIATRLGIEIVLVALTVLTAVGFVLDMSLFKTKRKPVEQKQGLLLKFADQSRGFFPILLVVLVLRSFLFEPFRVPTGSLKPTVLDGDFILVNKYHYGLRLPVAHNKIINVYDPKAGDIMVFHWPVNPKIDFVKRVVGVPGDRIRYQNKKLYRNGKLVPRVFERYTMMRNDQGQMQRVAKYEETLNGVKHAIYLRPDTQPSVTYDVTVPPEHYFMMGDNRDGSWDSRGWGFVPSQNIVGEAVLVWLSWDKYTTKWRDKIRWSRIGNKL